MSAELILAPDPVEVVVAELARVLPTVDGYTKAVAGGYVPSPRPALFVRVRSVGGAQDDVAHLTPTVTVEAYASSDGAAARLGWVCHAIMLAAGRNLSVGGHPCSSVGVFSLPQDLPDPTTDQSRSTATYAVSLRGVVA
ncbi:hypothetical protein EDF38_1307 [Frigoribacterium sp. PhB160]|uniref:hypothetical protein n=1 Tax=Frigoribacterium sp. PhB160 TaxID=2485192 RepID=UPI000F48C536|nr:hypothetical protein [Frigoribacterium sp. PhB160]ROS62204.1 hypothetical protein EDF38_1307 [Frigoribacterium sp. PhB160]